MDEWIKCSERLPAECEDILIYSKGMSVTGAYLTYDMENKPLLWTVNDWDESDRDISFDSVTQLLYNNRF